MAFACTDAGPNGGYYRRRAAGIGAELLSVQEGWQVTDIIEQSPAQNAGLAKGDLIVKINGEPVGKVDWAPEEGVTTLFTVQREGMTRDIVVIPQKIEPLSRHHRQDASQRLRVYSHPFLCPGGYGR